MAGGAQTTTKLPRQTTAWGTLATCLCSIWACIGVQWVGGDHLDIAPSSVSRPCGSCLWSMPAPGQGTTGRVPWHPGRLDMYMAACLFVILWVLMGFLLLLPGGVVPAPGCMGGVVDTVKPGLDTANMVVPGRVAIVVAMCPRWVGGLGHRVVVAVVWCPTPGCPAS